MTEEVKSPSNAINTDTPQRAGGSSSGDGDPSKHHDPTALEVI